MKILNFPLSASIFTLAKENARCLLFSCLNIIISFNEQNRVLNIMFMQINSRKCLIRSLGWLLVQKVFKVKHDVELSEIGFLQFRVWVYAGYHSSRDRFLKTSEELIVVENSVAEPWIRMTSFQNDPSNLISKNKIHLGKLRFPTSWIIKSENKSFDIPTTFHPHCCYLHCSFNFAWFHGYLETTITQSR